ncbi:hypothetical protein PPO43_12265 [Saprospira sp. CCB-QB6]|uniref:hypothetical protein n=1 Tax=Saprospira sp. CCB-QB6 TaxID=3023936 RepID=UPI00234A2D03|nr:hypothetical protein [Saprospira sp. CCB-QB6]WCL80744.1 hypothetical protein PPO43_12265 [Saprospira sp. CCB-QB6]
MLGIWRKRRKRGVFESDHCTMINKKTIFGQNLKALFVGSVFKGVGIAFKNAALGPFGLMGFVLNVFYFDKT